MAITSGASSFNLQLDELVEEAFERAGGELRTGYDLRTARRSLNIMFADWANRGINMWTIEQGEITPPPGAALTPDAIAAAAAEPICWPMAAPSRPSLVCVSLLVVSWVLSISVTGCGRITPSGPAIGIVPLSVVVPLVCDAV